MTPNDTQMDVLMRRYAKHSAERSNSTEHLDADELNAFAEGTLPAAARSQYVSHLADCGDCRQLVSQLAIASGAAAHAQVPASTSVEQKSWWQTLTAVLAPSTLKYAALAVVAIAVVGIAFIVWRQPAERNSALIAKNEPNPDQVRMEQAAASPQPLANQNTQSRPSESPVASAAAPASTPALANSDVVAVSPPPPPAKTETEPFLAAKKPDIAAAPVMDAPRSESSPSYAPAPSVGEYSVVREQQKVGGVTTGGSRRNESLEKYKTVDRASSGDVAKARDEDRGRAASNQTTTSESKQEESDVRARQRSAPVTQSRSADDKRAPARKTEAAETPKDTEASQTRSVGGRKFKREGNAWIDTRFKPSMSTKGVSRGSDDFDALDSGLRSIAQQLGGEVIVVWKGKAYRIR